MRSFYLPVITATLVCIAIAGHFESRAATKLPPYSVSASKAFECKLNERKYPTCEPLK